MPELVLYGIRLLAKQFLGTVLDIEVDQSAILMPTYSSKSVGWKIRMFDKIILIILWFVRKYKADGI